MSTLRDKLTLKKASDYADLGGWWEEFPLNIGYWHGVACSTDGTQLITCQYPGASGYPGRVYTSADSGKTWTERRPTGADEDKDWYSVASDADGSVYLASVYGGRIYLSTDSGVTWNEKQPAGASNYNWRQLACDSDGSVLIGCIYQGRLWMSVDSGANWTEPRPKGDANGNWRWVACDGDGSVIVACEESGRVYVSTDTGANWNERRPTGVDENKNWYQCAVSSTDGSVIIACSYVGRLWRSTNSGVDWTELDPVGDSSNHNWYAVALDADGSHIIVATYPGYIFTSEDSGSTWTRHYPLGNVTTNWYQFCGTSTGSRWFTCTNYGGRVMGTIDVQDKTALPMVYGDLSDSTKGIWKCPCIKRSTVYAYAGHAVLGSDDGNTVMVYKDGELLASSAYTFSESNDYQSLGTIATITFATDQFNAVITASGRGKVSSGTTVMDNIIDIINDELTVEGDFTSTVFDATSKAYASRVFAAQSYKAAGVVTEDRIYQELINEQMASFLGDSFQDGAGNLVLDIDDGTLSTQGVPVIPRGEVRIISIKQRLANVINQCPASYAYNYANGKFDSETDEVSHADLASQGIYDVCKPSENYPFYWCRDLASVQTMQDILVGKYARPVHEIEFEDITLKRLGLDVGNIFALTVDWLYDDKGSPLYNQYWKVTSVSPDFKREVIRFRAIQTSSYMTSGGVRDTTIY